MSTSSRHVVVIGGGVIGAACAYYLSRSGWQVTIIDKGGFGSGSSHGNCGLVCPSHVLPLAEPGMVIQGLAALFQKNSPLAIKFRMDPAPLVVADPLRHAVQPPRHDGRGAGHSAAPRIVAGRSIRS